MFQRKQSYIKPVTKAHYIYMPFNYFNNFKFCQNIWGVGVGCGGALFPSAKTEFPSTKTADPRAAAAAAGVGDVQECPVPDLGRPAGRPHCPIG